MRIAALCGLLAAASGCNQVFGLEEPAQIDAMIPVDAAPRTIFLTWQVALTTATGATLEYPPITPKPAVKVGPLPGQTIPEDPTWLPGDLHDADVDDAGGIEIPPALRGRTFRLVYRLPGETLDHEVQGSVSEGHLVAERFGPVARTTPPPNAGYTVPDPMPQGFATFMTTGVYTQFDGVVTPGMDGLRGTVSTAHSISGPLGVPEAEAAFKLAACDRSMGATVRCAVMTRDQLPALIANTDVAPLSTPVFDATLSQTDISGTISISADQRLRTALRLPSGGSGLYGTGENGSAPFFEIGLVPTLEMAPFIDEPAHHGGFNELVRPALLQLATKSSQGVVKFVIPMLGMNPVVYAHLTNFRIVNSGGVRLISALQSVTQMDTSTDIAFAAPLPTMYKLGTTALDRDGQPLAISGNAVELTWINDQGSADDYAVTLFEIVNGDAIPLRTWNVVDPRVVVDPSLLVSSKTYAFEIAARIGFPNARQVDFTTTRYPAARSSVFAGTFCVGAGPCP